MTARTRQLEEARGGGARRTEAARSELARLSSARLEPSVALRRKEFEGRAARREARSLDVHPHQGTLYIGCSVLFIVVNCCSLLFIVIHSCCYLLYTTVLFL